MKVTKRQLKRMIREMHPRAGVDDAIFEYEEWARERGSPPGASSVIASYFISLGNWSAPDMRMLGDHYGISSEDIQREVSIQREEIAADGDFKYASMPPMQGPRTKGASPPRGMPDGRLGRLGESRTKVTKRQLRRIIKEASSDDWANRRNRWAKFKHHMAREPQLYLDWVEKSGHASPASSSVMATYFLEMGLENEHKIHKKLASEIGLDHEDVMRDLKIQQSERSINMGESKVKITKRQLRRIVREETVKSTEKYDDDSALVGDQDKLHDKLQKAIIDKTVGDRKKRKNVSMKRITKRRLRKVIREACGLAMDVPEASLDFTPAIEEPSADVPVPGDYDAVRDLLDNNSGLVDLALSFVMIKAGTHCEKSSAQAIIDHLQDKVSGGVEEEPLEWETDGMPGNEVFGISLEARKRRLR